MNTIARQKRKKSIRAKLVGSSQRPRLNIFRSSKHIYASLINDEDGRTLVWASDRGIKDKMTKSEKAFLVGKQLAETASKKGLKVVVFDRAGYLYHGRVKKLYEGAREKGLKF